jgi:hypothetical protein
MNQHLKLCYKGLAFWDSISLLQAALEFRCSYVSRFTEEPYFLVFFVYEEIISFILHLTFEG